MGSEGEPFDERRRKPYTTGEAAKVLGIGRRTVIRMVIAGTFGPEGTGWHWSKGGPAKGARRLIVAKAVHAYLRRCRE